ncbi:MAG: hypothetical protein RID53_25835 [Coleofasciculus sp. B1-GNL1-01]|uniref:hypothetical protein n=1 Tax=Coleofasciculus sp. B1-GNL1-01 TaxID=3068484 RepID=UPI0032F8A528
MNTNSKWMTQLSTPLFTKCLPLVGTILAGLSFASSASAVTLSNGSLEVMIRDDNGAIDALIFDKKSFFRSDFFNPGNPVSDFGFQNGANPATFTRNTTTGVTQQPVTVAKDGDSVVVTGTYTGGGATVNFKRTYSLVDELNALLVKTDLINQGSAVDFRYFDTFDPDQGIDQRHGFETFNDVFTLETAAGIAKVGQATELGGLTVILGSLDTNTTVGADLGLSINNGFELNNFLNTPSDPNGTFADVGIHIGGKDVLLAVGDTASFEYIQGYGTSVAAAQAEFKSAAAATVPEPPPLLGLLAMGSFFVFTASGAMTGREMEGNKVLESQLLPKVRDRVDDNAIG